MSEVASQWSLAIGRSCDGFGMNALVEATTADGTAAVLKLAPPGDAEKLSLEATILRLADGDGCVRLAGGGDRLRPHGHLGVGTAERVLSGLWCRVLDHQPHGDKRLADAKRLCE